MEELIADFAKIIHDNTIQFGNNCQQYLRKYPGEVNLLGYKPLTRNTKTNLEINEQMLAKYKTEKMKEYKKLIKQLRTRRRTKRVKHKDWPKRPKNAYNLFIEVELPKIKAEHPSFSAPQLVKIAAVRYNKLTEEQKKPYYDRYLQSKAHFDQSRDYFFKTHPDMDYRGQIRVRRPSVRPLPLPPNSAPNRDTEHENQGEEFNQLRTMFKKMQRKEIEN